MTRQRLYLYDTTLRDGQQTQGVQFSAAEKTQIAAALDALGIDYIEGGWPGANPTDSEFFANAPQTRATMTAFGMTKRSGRSAENDDVLAGVLNARTPAVCLVGKAHDFHVRTALDIPLDENIENIRASIAHVVAGGREALFDAEHFFDGYRSNSAYALQAIRAAYDAGAAWVVLCDTNGGTLPEDIYRITSEVIASGISGARVGIHCHDDTGNAVANSLAAVRAGARHIQGTLNGLGERCGNANLVTLIPTLLLKEPFASTLSTGITQQGLASLLLLAVARPGWQRVPLLLGVLVVGLGMSALSTALSFGPANAWSWLTPRTGAVLGLTLLLAFLCALLPARANAMPCWNTSMFW
jgi:2-isopropylmalate synthase